MKKHNYVYGEYFCGNKISEYGLENGFVDYATFAKAFDAVLNNNIMSDLQNAGYYFEPENGPDYSKEIEELETLVGEYHEKSAAALDRACEVGYYEEVSIYWSEFWEKTSDHFERLEEETREQIEELEEAQYNCEIFQWYIVSDLGAELIKDYTSEYLYYCYHTF